MAEPQAPWPDGVSVIMPVLNEERHLSEAVAGILAQDWTGPLEIVLALGPSIDRTDEVARRLQALDDRIVLVPNPSGRTPAGLNAAMRASRHEVVVRVDGHAIVAQDYLSTAVEVMSRTGADSVGGIMVVEGGTPYEQAVARAMMTPLGAGATPVRPAAGEGEVESVYLGCFRASALARVGGYDETLLRAWDWDVNNRIRSAGGRVWFTPRLVIRYRPRPNPSALARQYFHYGRWCREVLDRHPEAGSGISAVRCLAPPAALGLALTGAAAGAVGLTVGPRALRGGLLVPLGYIALITGGAAAHGRGLPRRVRARLPLVYVTMHGSWGAGFVTSRGTRAEPTA